jgi:hypothetical protein
MLSLEILPPLVLIWIAGVTLRLGLLRGMAITARIFFMLLSLTILAVANKFLAAWLPYAPRGGGPEIGKIVDGHYFVGNHGRYFEVSRHFFEASIRYSDISTAILLIAAIVTTAYFSTWCFFRPGGPGREPAEHS